VTAVRRTLAALGAGLLVQRLCQLGALLLLARTLGREATGLHAQGVALGGLIAVAANAGLRNVVARALARAPESSGPWLAATVRARLLRTVVLLAVAVATATCCCSTPWFWCASAAAALPAAFDLKHIGDVAARTRFEVAAETGSSALFLALVAGWLLAGGTDLTVLAGIHFACRTVYALGAWHAMARLPRAGTAPRARELLRESRATGRAQLAGDLGVAADVCVVGWLAGNDAAGLYAVALRLAGAAGMPTAQLARLFFAHQLHAAVRGDAARTTRVALRATALVLLPMLAGGCVAAAPLCALFGEPFAAAAPALRCLLVAVTAQHLGWQAHQALLAAGRDRAYARALWWQAGAYVLLLGALAPTAGSTGSALAGAAAQTCFLAAALRGLDRGVLQRPRWLARPLAVALLTGAVTAAAAAVDAGPALPRELGAGALAFATGLYAVELRRRWRRLGAGLAQASGFRS
jgi:O-antigen/teichoic acid export membrane protein